VIFQKRNYSSIDMPTHTLQNSGSLQSLVQRARETFSPRRNKDADRSGTVRGSVETAKIRSTRHVTKNWRHESSAAINWRGPTYSATRTAAASLLRRRLMSTGTEIEASESNSVERGGDCLLALASPFRACWFTCSAARKIVQGRRGGRPCREL